MHILGNWSSLWQAYVQPPQVQPWQAIAVQLMRPSGLAGLDPFPSGETPSPDLKRACVPPIFAGPPPRLRGSENRAAAWMTLGTEAPPRRFARCRAFAAGG